MTDRPPWRDRLPERAGFVGDRALLDPVPAGVWIHADPGARSAEHRLGRLVHALPPREDRPALVLGTPGGRPLDLADVAGAVRGAGVAGGLDDALVVPFGVSLAELRRLAELWGRPLLAATGMPLASSGEVRTVGADGRPGWAPFVPVVRLEPDGDVVALSSAPVPDAPPGLTLTAVPAGVWVCERDAVRPDLHRRAMSVEIDPEGPQLVLGTGGEPSAIVSGAVPALLGRLVPALRSRTRVVSLPVLAEQAPPPPDEGVPDLQPSDEHIPDEPTPDERIPGEQTPDEHAPVGQAPLVAPDGRPTTSDRDRVRTVLGPWHGRLSGRVALVLALEPGRAAPGTGIHDDLVALSAVLLREDGRLSPDRLSPDTVEAALADPADREALLRCAAAGLDALATHRGPAFARLHVAAVPAPGDVLSAPLAARLSAAGDPTPAEPSDRARVLLAVRSRTLRRAGGLIANAAGDAGTEPTTGNAGADALTGPMLLAAAGTRFRVTAVERTDDAAGPVVVVRAEELAAGERSAAGTAPDTAPDPIGDSWWQVPAGPHLPGWTPGT